MKLSIIIPVYNEEKTVKEAIRRVKKVNLPIKSEIIVVDDGSTDKSYEKIKNIKNIKIYRHSVNKGKGAAIKTALKHLTGDIMIVYDADLELYAGDIPRLIQPIMDKKTKVVYGSRELYEHKRKLSLFCLGGRFVTFIANFLYPNLKITDEPIGFKVFRIEILNSLNLSENGFGFCPEVTSILGRMKIKIKEIPVHATSRTIKEGKKLRWTDGLEAVWILIKNRFKPLNLLTKKGSRN